MDTKKFGVESKDIKMWRNAMKIEECTKDELIWYIKIKVFYDEKELLFQVLLHRSCDVSKSAAQASEEACKALERYTEALKPYEGGSYMDVPDMVIMKASRALKDYEKYIAISNRYRSQHDRIQKQIDKLL